MPYRDSWQHWLKTNIYKSCLFIISIDTRYESKYICFNYNTNDSSSILISMFHILWRLNFRSFILLSTPGALLTYVQFFNSYPCMIDILKFIFIFPPIFDNRYVVDSKTSFKWSFLSLTVWYSKSLINKLN